jgi:hypothetical protein
VSKGNKGNQPEREFAAEAKRALYASVYIQNSEDFKAAFT